MEKQLVYLGLGGNIGDPIETFKKVFEQLSTQPQITDLEISPLYLTTPVSDIPQDDFINAVCSLKTTLNLEEFKDFLFSLETTMGKRPKKKNAPRIIDIDILFFGTKRVVLQDLHIPHLRWQERLFVLKPLSDLTDHIAVEDAGGCIKNIDLNEMLNHFTNRHQEVVKKLERIER
ncbi:MAG: 2-amino-4-hydroxy-6-hydroxymethyldihydropteridine diphosphokinase [Chlamydiota bacterium]